MSTGVNQREADVQACLERVLASPVFMHAERQKRLLRYLVSRDARWTLRVAQGLYDRRGGLDPSYAEPQAWLARVHTFRWITGLKPRREESLDVAMRLALRAIELAPEMALGHGVLSWVCTWSGLCDEAIRAARRAVALDAGNAETHYWLGVSLSCGGVAEEAAAELAQAMRLNPHYPIYYVWAYAQSRMFVRRFDEAIEAAQQVRAKRQPISAVIRYWPRDMRSPDASPRRGRSARRSTDCSPITARTNMPSA